MSLENFFGTDNIRKSYSVGFIFAALITVICWAIFKYNWAFNVPLFLGTVYVHNLLRLRVRVYRYLITAIASFFWGFLSMLLAGFIYLFFKDAFKVDLGFYFIVLFSGSVYGLSIYGRYKEFKKEQLEPVENGSGIKALQSNKLGIITLVVCTFFYLVFLTGFIAILDKLPAIYKDIRCMFFQ